MRTERERAVPYGGAPPAADNAATNGRGVAETTAFWPEEAAALSEEEPWIGKEKTATDAPRRQSPDRRRNLMKPDFPQIYELGLFLPRLISKLRRGGGTTSASDGEDRRPTPSKRNDGGGESRGERRRWLQREGEKFREGERERGDA